MGWLSDGSVRLLRAGDKDQGEIAVGQMGVHPTAKVYGHPAPVVQGQRIPGGIFL